ncbi:MAG: reverse gyrase [Nitrososphaerota archaeon]|nr:reverse gyrase [Nitrososphaerota archaeon]
MKSRRLDSMISILNKMCPNCGGDIESTRLEKGIPCRKCLPNENLEISEIAFGKLREIIEINRLEEEWFSFFKDFIGSPAWSLQVSWARKVFLKRSFALIAPTGIGKTSFGISMAAFLASKDKKSYIIVPTRILVEQVKEKLERIIDSNWIIAFGKMSEKEKAKAKERLKSGNFRVLISTSMFLYKNYEIIPRPLDFVFIDDVDSFLKSAKNIDKSLYLINFDKEDIEKAMRLIKMKGNKNGEAEALRDEVKEISKKAKGVIVVSSATSNPKTSRIRLYRELLGFEVGRPSFYIRNVVDAFTFSKEEYELIKWVKKLGKGGLVFVSSDKGKEYVDRVIGLFSENGIRAISYEDINEENLKKYETGEIDVLVGISSYRNPLARGLDIPHVIKYALFFGVPKIIVSLRIEGNALHLLWLLASIRSIFSKNESLKNILPKIDGWLRFLRRSASLLSEEGMVTSEKDRTYLEKIKEEIIRLLEDEIVLKTIEKSKEISLRKTEEGFVLVISDATAYLQASGRTSRLYAQGLTKGFSLIFVDDEKSFYHLQKKVRWFGEEINFIDVTNINIDSLMNEIEKERKLIRKILKGVAKDETKDILKPILLIVESPNKARTIANFFGKPMIRFVNGNKVYETTTGENYLMITASLGHIFDLVKDKHFHGVIVKDSITPEYEIIEGKENIIESLKQIGMEIDRALIATDPDTEGEKISHDLMLLLKPFVKKIERARFHEVTRKAIIQALREPIDFNLNLVKAQVVRRIADRWVGFELSQYLQKKFEKNWLSAGRVQTPVLGWIIERYDQSGKKIPTVIINLNKEGKTLRIEFPFEDRKQALNFFNKLEKIEIKILEEKLEIKSPPPPYRTDTMLRDAGEKLGFSLQKTMQLAQDLFEMGYITYHRTDSIRVSDAGIGLAKEYFGENLSLEYFHPRIWSKEGAHECIRPTRPLDVEDLKTMIFTGQVEGLTKDHIMLYDLIFRRFIASQMRECKAKILKLSVKAMEFEKEIDITKEIVEDGFNVILKFETHPLFEGTVEVLNTKKIVYRPKAYPHTWASIVQEMKEKGLGRPSTYATIVQTLLERGYVFEKKGFLIPTKLGRTIYSYLKRKEEIAEFVSEDFTRRVEEEMDEVEMGKKDWQKVLFELYNELKNAMEKLYKLNQKAA